MIQRLWKNLRLQNQILTFQSIVVALIFITLISLCLYLVHMFSTFIKQELLQSLILKSMISTIQISVIRVDRIGQIGYYQQMASGQSLQNLYEFQVKNNIEMTSQIDDCLQTPHSQQFYSYEFCYGLYGKQQSQNDLSQIKSFVALQNQFKSLQQIQQIKAYYNIYLDEQLFFSQYQGEYIKTLDQSMIDAIKYLQNSQELNFFQQLFNQTGQMFVSLNTIPETKIVLGYKYNQTEYLYYKLTQSQEYFNQRSLSVLENGIILTDTNNFYAFGMQFQNTSLTGFDDYQFQKIKNFTYRNYTVLNECQVQLQNRVLCLLNVNGTEKLIFSRLVNSQRSRFLIIVIVDSICLKNIKDDFNQQLQILIDEILYTITNSQIIMLVICILLQIAFIRRLNKPIHDLQDIAKSHINNLQQKMSKLIIRFQTQNQIQKLADAFFNLLNLKHINRKKEQLLKIKRRKQYQGILFKRDQQKIIYLLQQNIKQIRYYSEN